MSTSRNETYDTLTILKATGLVGASAAQSLILDMQSGASSGSLGVGPRTDSDLVIDISALEVASDESYDIVLQGSPDAAFGTAGNIQDLMSIHLGHSASKRTDSDKTDVIGRIIVPVTNEFNGTIYRYLRLYVVVSGTVATGINFTARLGKRFA